MAYLITNENLNAYNDIYHFAGKDILDISSYVGGKVLQLIIGFLYLLIIVIICATLIQYFAESLKILYFPNTPISLIIVVFLFGAVVANYTGTKSINNLNTIIVPIRAYKHAHYFYLNC